MDIYLDSSAISMSDSDTGVMPTIKTLAMMNDCSPQVVGGSSQRWSPHQRHINTPVILDILLYKPPQP